MTFDQELREASDKDGLLELNLRPFHDSKKRLVWKATAGMASDPRMLIGIDADPVDAIRKALRVLPNELVIDDEPETTEGVFG
ncbi:hypothetical protein [Nitratireductor soli]|uniref:hypothetical protein n=1 Tax=Nitratireductor soli TaxID=1670619 RepID=UPI00065E55C1|nr:hypothetical protein [Nitratireductor soli]